MAQIHYALDGAAVLSTPAGQPALAEQRQLHDEGFINLVRHWYDVATDQDFAEYRRAE